MACLLTRRRAASSVGRAPCGPGYWKTLRWAASKSSKPRSCSRSSMCRCTASQGTRRSAPISGGPNGFPAVAELVKGLDGLFEVMYRQVTLPPTQEEEGTMAASTSEEIKVGEHVIRFLVEGEQSAGSVAVFEFD